jgi:hypothetical protein
VAEVTNQLPVTVGLLVGALAVVIWAIVLVRALLEWRHQEERRISWVMMAGTAFLASVGTLSSSIGFGIQSGVLDVNLSQPMLSFVASVGRGALVMGGLIVLTHARPPKVRP